MRRSKLSSSTTTEKVIHLVYHDESCGIMRGKYVMVRGKYTESAWKACYHMGRLLFNGPRPLKSTGRHGVFKALVTWDMNIS